MDGGGGGPTSYVAIYLQRTRPRGLMIRSSTGIRRRRGLESSAKREDESQQAASLKTNNADVPVRTGWRRQSKSLPCLGFVVPSPCNYILIVRQHEHGLVDATLQGRQPANENLGLSSVKAKLKEGGFLLRMPFWSGMASSWAGPLASAAPGPDNLFCCCSMHLGAKEGGGGGMRGGRQRSRTEYKPRMALGFLLFRGGV